MPESVRIAVIGGGSPFVLSFIHGLAANAARWIASGFAIHLSLYDLAPERAARWARYADVAYRQTGLPIRASVAGSRDEALRDSRLVLVSAGAPDAYSLAHAMRDQYGFPYHSIHDGPPGFAAAKRLYPFCRDIGEAAMRLSPRALVLLLPNPTDALANAVARATGANVAGLCVEVEHLRDHLAYYTRRSPESIQLEHAGVNHDGWTLRLWIDGADGYPLLRDAIPALPERDDFHPGNWGMVRVYEATGLLRSSAYHNWPLEVGSFAGPAKWESFGVNREDVLRLADAAIRDGGMIDPREDLHPERRPVKYGGTGVALERILWGQASRQPQIVAMQVRNDGAVTNLPNDVQVEVPTVICGESRFPRAMGSLPERIAGTTRLLAIQRKLEADYLLDGKKRTLLDALMAFPTVAPVGTLIDYAEELHATA